ncbi:MAG: hypothetical protein Rhob2KO_35800 [Rhodopirellula baltica]
MRGEFDGDTAFIGLARNRFRNNPQSAICPNHYTNKVIDLRVQSVCVLAGPRAYDKGETDLIDGIQASIQP